MSSTLESKPFLSQEINYKTSQRKLRTVSASKNGLDIEHLYITISRLTKGKSKLSSGKNVKF